GDAMRALSLAVLAPAGLLVLAAAARPAESQTEDDRLTAFFQAHLDKEFRQRPLEATRLGDHRFDHLLDDLSPKARAGWAKRYRATLADLPRQVDYKKLTRPGQIDYEILEHHLKRELWLVENTRPFEDDPRTWNDYLTESIYLLLTQSTLPRARNVKNAAARLAQLPRVIEAAKASLGRPPRVCIETALRQNRGGIAFYQKGVFELAGETAALSELKPAAAKAVEALKGYQKWLEETLLPRAGGDWRIGKEKFAQKLEYELNAGLSAARVLCDAEAEFTRVEREMVVVARQLWSRTHPGKALPPDDPAGRRQLIRAVLGVLNRD